MDLSEMTERLVDTLDTPTNMRSFQRAREREPALADYADVHEVLILYENFAPEVFDEKAAVTCALVAEAQRGDHLFWCSVLQLAFRSLLIKISGRIIDRVVERDEIDNIVMLAFWETVLALPRGAKPSSVFIRLKQGTKRRAFTCIAAAQRAAQDFNLRPKEVMVLYADEYYVPEGEDPLEHEPIALWPETSPPKTSAVACPGDQEAQIAFLREHACDVLTPGEMEAVIIKLVRGQRLSTYSRTLNAGKPPSVGIRHYARIRRRYSRGIQKLRTAFGPLMRDRMALRGYREGPGAHLCHRCGNGCRKTPGEAPRVTEQRVDFSEAGDLEGIAR